MGAGSNGIRANGFSGYINQYTVKVMLTAGQHCHLVAFMKFGDDAKGMLAKDYENLPIQYTEIYSAVKIKHFIGKMIFF